MVAIVLGNPLQASRFPMGGIGLLPASATRAKYIKKEVGDNSNAVFPEAQIHFRELGVHISNFRSRKMQIPSIELGVNVYYPIIYV